MDHNKKSTEARERLVKVEGQLRELAYALSVARQQDLSDEIFYLADEVERCNAMHRDAFTGHVAEQLQTQAAAFVATIKAVSKK